MLRELAFSQAPLEAAVKLALLSRGVSYSASEVERYASLLTTSRGSLGQVMWKLS